MAAENDDVLEQAIRWQADGKSVALATVVGTWGSSPRPAGSLLAVDPDGAFVGSVSGGCVEGAVVENALDIIRGGAHRLLDFGISDDQAWAVGLACGGEMKVFVEAAPPADDLKRLLHAKPVAQVTDLDSGDHAWLSPDDRRGPLDLGAAETSAVRQALRENRSQSLSGGRALFATVYNPPLRMVIVGAVHVAQTLAPMASMAGFQVTVIDPRHSFATEDRFPGVDLCDDWPDDAMAAVRPDARTAVVTLTHDPKLDDPALAAALRSNAFYIGALGSRRTHARRVERLKAMGFDDGAVGRIHAPIGLPLGGRKASEIAVAVLAEVIGECYRTEDALAA